MQAFLIHKVAQVVSYLEENLDAAPGALGEPGKETPEELAQRHERVAAASLLALASLLDLTLGAAGRVPGSVIPCHAVEQWLWASLLCISHVLALWAQQAYGCFVVMQRR